MYGSVKLLGLCINDNNNYYNHYGGLYLYMVVAFHTFLDVGIVTCVCHIPVRILSCISNIFVMIKKAWRLLFPSHYVAWSIGWYSYQQHSFVLINCFQGDEIKTELLSLLDELPLIYEGIGASISSLKNATHYYETFVNFLVPRCVASCVKKKKTCQMHCWVL